MPETHWESAIGILYCPCISRNIDDWAVGLVSVLFGASAAA